MKILQKPNLKAKLSQISMKFHPRVTWANLSRSRGDVFVYARLRSCHVLSLKIGRKTDKKLSQIKILFR